MSTTVQTEFVGQVGVLPRIVKIATTDSYAAITANGFLESLTGLGYTFYPNDIFAVSYGTDSATSEIFTMNSNGDLQSVSSVVQKTVSAAAPGTVRALTGKITETATTMTSGNLVGARGEVNAVGASGGFLYGVQGKVTPTGTLSGSSWTAAVFGQFDVSAATVNAGQLAAIWGDWGTTGATATDMTGCRGIAFTNTTANVLNAQDYRYGNATNLWELAGAGGTLNYYLNAGTSAGSAGDAAHCAAQKVIRVTVNGTAAYIPVFTQNT